MAFVVLAHKAPEQVERLVARLAPCPVHLHVDRRAPATVHTDMAAVAAGQPHVLLVDPHASGWASFGLVRAALAGLAAAIADGASHVMLLSGQDYPLRSGAALADFFHDHAGESFVPHWRLPSKLWGSSGGYDRLRVWQIPVRGRRVRLPVPLRMPPGLHPYGGSMYWALSRDAASHVLDTLEQRPEIARFYRRTWIPDEMVVPTLVMNSPQREHVLDENLVYIRWPRAGGKHPAMLGLDELEALRAAANGPSAVGGPARCKLFARKFDSAHDPRILDALDRTLLGAGG